MSQCGVDDPTPAKWTCLWDFRHPRQYRSLVGLEIHEEDMLAVLQRLFETREVVIGVLDPNQSPLPGAKAEHHDGEENEGDPAGGSRCPAGKMGDTQNQHESAQYRRRRRAAVEWTTSFFMND